MDSNATAGVMGVKPTPGIMQRVPTPGIMGNPTAAVITPAPRVEVAVKNDPAPVSVPSKSRSKKTVANPKRNPVKERIQELLERIRA